MTFLIIAVIGLAIFLCGVVASWLWVRSKGSDSLVKRLNLGLSVFFLLVGLLVAADITVLTYRFNRYVDTSLLRDANQERCSQQTLAALRVWAEARSAVEDSKTERDHALIPLFDEIIRGEQVSPDTAVGVQRAITHVEDERTIMNQKLKDNPIPTCQLGPVS